MLETDECALMCDLAETYHIYDYKSLPLQKVAIFCIGLRENSRIKMQMNDMKYPIETMLLAAAVDHLAISVWLNSKDGQTGTGRPDSLVSRLMAKEKEDDVMSFDTPEEFEKTRAQLVKKGGV